MTRTFARTLALLPSLVVSAGCGARSSLHGVPSADAVIPSRDAAVGPESGTDGGVACTWRVGAFHEIAPNEPMLPEMYVGPSGLLGGRVLLAWVQTAGAFSSPLPLRLSARLVDADGTPLGGAQVLADAVLSRSTFRGAPTPEVVPAGDRWHVLMNFSELAEGPWRGCFRTQLDPRGGFLTRLRVTDGTGTCSGLVRTRDGDLVFVGDVQVTSVAYAAPDQIRLSDSDALSMRSPVGGLANTVQRIVREDGGRVDLVTDDFGRPTGYQAIWRAADGTAVGSPLSLSRVATASALVQGAATSDGAWIAWPMPWSGSPTVAPSLQLARIAEGGRVAVQRQLDSPGIPGTAAVSALRLVTLRGAFAGSVAVVRTWLDRSDSMVTVDVLGPDGTPRSPSVSVASPSVYWNVSAAIALDDGVMLYGWRGTAGSTGPVVAAQSVRCGG